MRTPFLVFITSTVVQIYKHPIKTSDDGCLDMHVSASIIHLPKSNYPQCDSNPKFILFGEEKKRFTVVEGRFIDLLQSITTLSYIRNIRLHFD